MGLYETRYFLWFFKRDLAEAASMLKGQGLSVTDNEQFNLWVRKGTKVRFFSLHLFILAVVYVSIKSIA